MVRYLFLRFFPPLCRSLLSITVKEELPGAFVFNPYEGLRDSRDLSVWLRRLVVSIVLFFHLRSRISFFISFSEILRRAPPPPVVTFRGFFLRTLFLLSPVFFQGRPLVLRLPFPKVLSPSEVRFFVRSRGPMFFFPFFFRKLDCFIVPFYEIPSLRRPSSSAQPYFSAAFFFPFFTKDRDLLRR